MNKMERKVLFHRENDEQVRRFFYLAFDFKQNCFFVLVANRRGEEFEEVRFELKEFLADVSDPGRRQLLEFILTTLSE